VFQITDYGKLPARILHLYTDLRMSRLYGYQLNHVTYGQLVRHATDNGLQMNGNRRFMSYLPGMGRLPNSWLFRYQLWSMRNAFLSNQGTEAILMFRRPIASANGTYGNRRHLAGLNVGIHGSGGTGAGDVSS
jgi:hypothetical protein